MKLTTEQKKEIVQLNKSGLSYKDLASKFSVSAQKVRELCELELQKWMIENHPNVAIEYINYSIERIE